MEFNEIKFSRYFIDLEVFLFHFRYGINLVLGRDCSYYFMFNAFPYLGKGSIKKTERVNQGQFLTIKLLEDCFDTDQTVTADNWFTSLPLAKALQENGLNIVGTVKKKPYIPTVMTDMSKTTPTGTTAFFFSKDSIVIFYKAKSDKVVTLLSTIHHSIGFGEKNKSTALLYYKKH